MMGARGLKKPSRLGRIVLKRHARVLHALRGKHCLHRGHASHRDNCIVGPCISSRRGLPAATHCIGVGSCSNFSQDAGAADVYDLSCVGVGVADNATSSIARAPSDCKQQQWTPIRKNVRSQANPRLQPTRNTLQQARILLSRHLVAQCPRVGLTDWGCYKFNR